jgi:hypothetical protein
MLTNHDAPPSYRPAAPMAAVPIRSTPTRVVPPALGRLYRSRPSGTQAQRQWPLPTTPRPLPTSDRSVPVAIGTNLTSIIVYNFVCCCGILKYLFTLIHTPISYLRSETGSASSLPCVSLCGETMNVGQW